MLLQTFFFWCLLLVYLFPVLIIGIIIIRKTSSIDRFELLVPVGSIFGISLFVFLINIVSFFVKGIYAIELGYGILSLIVLFLIPLSLKSSRIDIPSGKQVIFYLLSILVWGSLFFWKGNYALIGSDTNLYYGIAHTFIKGNFPTMTPWQPDLALSYHLGISELLGAFYSFSGLPFEFLHIFFAGFFILLCSQIVIWGWKRHDNIFSFIWGNLSAAVIFISFGFFKIIIPYFPIKFPNILNLHGLFLWIRNLPTVNQSIEVYGAPVNLDGLIYFIFHAFGLAVLLSLIMVTIYPNKSSILSWVSLLVGLISLALINESVFIISAPALIFGALLMGVRNKTLLKNLKFIILLCFISLAIIIMQGGMITNLFFPLNRLEKSVLIFPNKSDIQEDFIAYHHYQEISKTLILKQEWFPFRWFHIGSEVLILICLFFFTYTKYTSRQKILVTIFFIAGITSLLSYNYIVPKFLIANGNRFLVLTFINFSLFIMFSLQQFFDNFSKRKSWLKNLILTILVIFIFIPSILPPLALLSKSRFGESKLIPKFRKDSQGIEWMRLNLAYNNRVVVLDSRAPHPSGMARAIVESGVFAPLFPGEFRAYTIEATPEYFDIAYYLSPYALRKLKINIVFIDNVFYLTLPEIRKQDLENNKYFDKLFDNSGKTKNWEKIYRVKENYLATGTEIERTFKQFINLFSPKDKIYIDNEENFEPNYLRRAIIFSLRDKDLYYLPQSGVYLNVESNIKMNPLLDTGEYDYLILGKDTYADSICKCRTKLIWQGIKDKVFIWKRINGNSILSLE